jgi:hypothetical protein
VIIISHHRYSPRSPLGIIGGTRCLASGVTEGTWIVSVHGLIQVNQDGMDPTYVVNDWTRRAGKECWPVLPFDGAPRSAGLKASRLAISFISNVIRWALLRHMRSRVAVRHCCGAQFGNPSTKEVPALLAFRLMAADGVALL